MSARTLKTKLLFGHFLFALAVITPQPLLPRFQETLGLSIFESSSIPVTLTLAVMTANIFAGFLIARLGQRRLWEFAALAGIVGSLIVWLTASYIGLLAGLVVIGLGIGTAFTSMTTIYASLPEKMQNFGVYHAFFGLGGMAAPAVGGFWIAAGLSIFQLYLVYAGLFFLLLILVASGKSLKNTRYESVTLKEMISVVVSPVVRIGILAVGLYAAVEIGLTTWAANMSVDGYGLSEPAGAAVLSVFWLLFTVSRVFSDNLAERFGPMNYVFATAMLAAGLIALWVTGLHPWLLASLGLFFGPMFPIVQKYINSHLPAHQKGLFNGVTYAATGVAGSTVISLMGSLAELRMAFAFIPTLIFMLIFAAVVIIVRRRMGAV
jgi:fucose permease